MTDGNLQTLMGAGFTQEESEAALRHTYNDVGRALQNLQVSCWYRTGSCFCSLQLAFLVFG